MKAAIFLKDSKGKRAAALRAWVAEKGFTDIVEYRHAFPVWGHYNDKEFRSLIRDAREQIFDFVFVASLEDLDLNPSNVLLLIISLRSLGVCIVSQEEDWPDLSGQELKMIYLVYEAHRESKASERLGKLQRKKRRKHTKHRDKDSLKVNYRPLRGIKRFLWWKNS